MGGSTAGGKKRVVIVMGVAASGKSTLCRALVDEFPSYKFLDADDFHSRANVEKMRLGRALDDEDRMPWLESLNSTLRRALESSCVVLACSALKEAYRIKLGEGLDPEWVFLDCSEQILDARIRARPGHFMNPNLIQSQLETLEPPASAIRLDADQPVCELVNWLRGVLQDELQDE